jgi:uncharacterized protein
LTAVSYADSSTLVELAVAEPETPALRRYLRRHRQLVSSAQARTEVLRALLEEGEDGLASGRAVRSRVDLVRVNDRVLNLAAPNRAALARRNPSRDRAAARC